jgi:cellulose synthase/poly-beta-1,6-N-acetylglucosamine synthase-like glycosyltransferase
LLDLYNYALLTLLGLFSFFGVLHLFYQLFFFSRTGTFSQINNKSNDNPFVSVIVCARNELENLKKLIPYLLEQDYPNYEIIIVDDRSEDAQYDFLLEQRSVHKNLRLVRIHFTPEGMNPKKYALTIGIRAAKGEHLLFTDADCVPASNLWIKSMISAFGTNDEIVLGYAPYIKNSSLLNLLIRYDTFYTAIQYFSFALAGLPYMGVGRNLAYRKSLFMKLKGFYKHIHVTGGDDDLFVNRAAHAGNVSVCAVEDAYTYSLPKTSWKAWFRQKKRHYHAGKYYKSFDKLNLSLLHGSNFAFYFFGFQLFFYSDLLIPVAIGFGVKWLVQIMLFYRIKEVIKEPIPVLLFPLLDVVHTFISFVFGTAALFSKRVTW